MVDIELTETIDCTPDEFLEFVMDIDRYATVDDKISPILWTRRDGDVVEFACRPKLAGLRQPKVVQQLRLTRGRRIDVSLAPLPRNRVANAMARFTASFECAETGAGTNVTRRLEFRFTPTVQWFLEPLVRRRLPNEVRDELARAKEGPAAQS